MNDDDLKHLNTLAEELARGDLRVEVDCDEAGFLDVVVTKESGGPQPLSIKRSIKFSDLAAAEQFVRRVIEEARRAGAAR